MIHIFCIFLLFLGASNSYKIWIPNTNVNNNLNWDKQDIPKDCDNIGFLDQMEVSTFWNLEKVVVSGLSLPKTGDVIFSRNIRIQFRNKEKCDQVREMKYIRHEVKGWLDPYNWKIHLGPEWLPHVQRVPCSGEDIFFPPEKTFAVQLPSILVPVGDITFDGEVFQGDTWSTLLKTDLGYQLFKGPDDIRSIPWRDDIGCFHKKECICGRSSYTIREGRYKETDPKIFEEAVCLYAMPKCQSSGCLYPVTPEGHCCGICGAIIILEDNTEDGLYIGNIKAQLEEEIKISDPERKLKYYVGRLRDGNIQIVLVAENPDDTMKSHTMEDLVKRRMTDLKFQVKHSRVSGLRFSNYVFNSVSGVFWGTLVAVLTLFGSLYYVYVILPKKTFSSSAANPFMFARFENTVNEENLEIGVEPEVQQDLPQAFDNPMYSGEKESKVEESVIQSTTSERLSELTDIETSLETTTTKEYTNPVYSELEKTKDLDGDQLGNGEEEFTEIKF